MTLLRALTSEGEKIDSIVVKFLHGLEDVCSLRWIIAHLVQTACCVLRMVSDGVRGCILKRQSHGNACVEHDDA